MRLLVDGEGEVWIKPGDEARFEKVRERSHLFYTFQYVLCWFINLKGRNSTEKNGQDTLLLITIRRINIFEWGNSESPTKLLIIFM